MKANVLYTHCITYYIDVFIYFQPPSSEAVPDLSNPSVMASAGGMVPILSEVPHPPPGIPIPQYNVGEYLGQHAWPANIIVSQLNQPLEVCIHLLK